MGLTIDQQDLCAGLALLYMSIQPDSEYINRMKQAMEAGDTCEAEHVSALLLMLLDAESMTEKWMFDRWSSVWTVR